MCDRGGGGRLSGREPVSDGILSLCVCGAVTGLLLLLFPSGSAGAAGRRAASVCYLVECMRLLRLALKGW